MRQASFSRTIAFPEDINHDSAKATLEDGVLKVTVQPIKPAAAKKIPITMG
jgi:HSP20 family molecular chaperone IbpA